MRYLLMLVAILAVGCGSSPTAPAPATLAGNWTGTFQYTKNTGVQVEAIAMVLTQASAGVNGTWSSNFRRGTVSGTVSATNFSGSLTYNTTSTQGGSCIGSFAVSGTAGGNTFQWTSPVVTENCTDPPRNITIAMQQR